MKKENTPDKEEATLLKAVAIFLLAVLAVAGVYRLSGLDTRKAQARAPQNPADGAAVARLNQLAPDDMLGMAYNTKQESNKTYYLHVNGGKTLLPAPNNNYPQEIRHAPDGSYLCYLAKPWGTQYNNNAPGTVYYYKNGKTPQKIQKNIVEYTITPGEGIYLLDDSGQLWRYWEGELQTIAEDVVTFAPSASGSWVLYTTSEGLYARQKGQPAEKLAQDAAHALAISNDGMHIYARNNREGGKLVLANRAAGGGNWEIDASGETQMWLPYGGGEALVSAGGNFYQYTGRGVTKVLGSPGRYVPAGRPVLRANKNSRNTVEAVTLSETDFKQVVCSAGPGQEELYCWSNYESPQKMAGSHKEVKRSPDGSEVYYLKYGALYRQRIVNEAPQKPYLVEILGTSDFIPQWDAQTGQCLWVDYLRDNGTLMRYQPGGGKKELAQDSEWYEGLLAATSSNGTSTVFLGEEETLFYKQGSEKPLRFSKNFVRATRPAQGGQAICSAFTHNWQNEQRWAETLYLFDGTNLKLVAEETEVVPTYNLEEE